MPKLSLIIHTASVDAFLTPQGIPSYFAALCNNLTFQTYQDFELVYVDTYYEQNRNKFQEVAAGFCRCVKHVPVHPNHRYWYDLGHCYISAAKNSGILYADGELCVSCDDAEFFPAAFLERYWWHYSHGQYMHALHRRLRSVGTENGMVRMPVCGDEYVNDSRWSKVANGPHVHHTGNWCYAGTSFSLGDALRLNGFNERMDGCKSLEDCDFGSRLGMLGRSFALDPEGYAYIVDHGSYAADANCGWEPVEGPEAVEGQEAVPPPTVQKVITNFIAVENHGLYRCARELVDPVANRNPLTPAHWKIIQADTIHYRKFDPLAPEHAANLAIWKGTPTFNLAAERDALRRSPDWKW